MNRDYAAWHLSDAAKALQMSEDLRAMGQIVQADYWLETYNLKLADARKSAFYNDEMERGLEKRVRITWPGSGL